MALAWQATTVDLQGSLTRHLARGSVGCGPNYHSHLRLVEAYVGRSLICWMGLSVIRNKEILRKCVIVQNYHSYEEGLFDL